MIKISSKKAEKKARQAVRSADGEYESLLRRGSFGGISKAERDYTMKMAYGAKAEADRVRRANHYPPYGVSEADYTAEKKEYWRRKNEEER